MKVSVVGGGLYGLCIARALAADGHVATVLDQGPIPNPRAASVDRHRLIRHAYGREAGYTNMVDAACEDWQALWAELGRTLWHADATLLTAESRAAPLLADTVATFADQGRESVWLEPAEIPRRFPALTATGVGAALLVPTGYVFFADRVVAALAEALTTRGVILRPHQAVAEIDPERGRVHLADGSVVDADLVVVAAGVWTTRLLPALAGRLTPSRQVVAYLQPPRDLHPLWDTTPMLLDAAGGIGFNIVPGVAGTPVKVSDHLFTRAGDPDDDRSVPEAEVAAMAATAGTRLAQFDRYRLLGGRSCYYMVEPDERFIVEPVGGRRWVVSACSGHGFKFAPTIARGLAATIAGRHDPAVLTAWAAGVQPLT